MIGNRKFGLFQIDKIMRCFLANYTRKFNIFPLLFIATFTGVIFLENIVTESLPPVQALTLKRPGNDGIKIPTFIVGDGNSSGKRRFRSYTGISFVIVSQQNNAKIILNYQQELQNNLVKGSNSKKIEVLPGENLYTVADENNKIIDEFIIRGIPRKSN